MEEWLKNLWYNISGLKLKDEIRKQAKDASNFVVSYVNSPGFKERLKLVPKFIKEYELSTRYNKYPKDLSSNLYDYSYGVELKPFVFYTYYPNGDEAYFNPKNNRVYIPNELSSISENYGNTAAHEYGHVLNKMLHPYILETGNFYRKHPEFEGKDRSYKKEFDYAEIFPHFRNSKSYLHMLFRFINDEELLNNYERMPKIIYDFDSISHDADPGESYADLIKLRYDLNATGIYDSRKANNPFTKEHLLKYKALKRKQRLFDNFTDDLIIKMMNEIAQNISNLNNNQMFYAKQGTKLISKAKSGIHIKEENKGKFTKSAKAAGQSVQEHAKSVLNNPNATKLQKKRANFARNSASWKHLFGGRIKKRKDGDIFNGSPFNNQRFYSIIEDRPSNKMNLPIWSTIGNVTNRYNLNNDHYLKEMFIRSKNYGFNNFQIAAMIANAVHENLGSPLSAGTRIGLWLNDKRQVKYMGNTIESNINAFIKDYEYGKWYDTYDKNGWNPKYHKLFKDGKTLEDVVFGMTAGYERFDGGDNRNNSEVKARIKTALEIYKILLNLK